MSHTLDRVLLALAGALLVVVGVRRKLPGPGFSGGLFILSALLPFGDDDDDRRGDRDDAPDPVSSGMGLPSNNGRDSRRVAFEPMPEPIARRLQATPSILE